MKMSWLVAFLHECTPAVFTFNQSPSIYSVRNRTQLSHAIPHPWDTGRHFERKEKNKLGYDYTSFRKVKMTLPYYTWRYLFLETRERRTSSAIGLAKVKKGSLGQETKNSREWVTDSHCFYVSYEFPGDEQSQREAARWRRDAPRFSSIMASP